MASDQRWRFLQRAGVLSPGWVDAWVSSPSACAVAARKTADIDSEYWSADGFTRVAKT